MSIAMVVNRCDCSERRLAQDMILGNLPGWRIHPSQLTCDKEQFQRSNSIVRSDIETAQDEDKWRS